MQSIIWEKKIFKIKTFEKSKQKKNNELISKVMTTLPKLQQLQKQSIYE